MKELPSEIIYLFAEALEELDVSEEHPLAHLHEQSTNSLVNWFSLTSGARQSICNFRLVCQKFYTGSVKSFARVLGERKIRITRVGLQDLEAFTKIPDLAPCITTLTFGNAGFYDPSKPSFKYIEENFKQICNSIDHDRVLQSYTEAAEWASPSNIEQHGRMLLRALVSLPNLQCVRFVDEPIRQVRLDGWLEPEDQSVVRRAQSSGSELSGLDRHFIPYQTVPTKDLMTPISWAIARTNIRLRDVRLTRDSEHFNWRSFPASPFDLTEQYSEIEMLRSIVKPRAFEPADSTTSITPQRTLVEASTKLRDVSLTLQSRHEDFTVAAQICATKWLVQHLARQKHLNRLALDGVWTFSRDDLVQMITQAGSLQYLILYAPQLRDSSWTAVIKELVALAPMSMKLLEIVMPMAPEADGGRYSFVENPSHGFDDVPKDLRFAVNLKFPISPWAEFIKNWRWWEYTLGSYRH
ncbi:hypothetical protein BDV96DRAFT_646990 [Lophiotrema nucula]|uniref:Uncharacterized protein n=1 Tax=Lophiotrema nucula TaxID=690887 RepID=A0A6A5Z9Q2_9PLEO|nr:hypothetical protein BDV96DRAFT_646990 [Lophiotrema nucula]